MRLLAFALAVMATFTTFGINPADSVKVYFRVGQRHFDPSLAENRREMADFIAKVREGVDAGNIERITVSGYASPDGIGSANERLAHNRSVTIAEYIVANTGISRELIEEKRGGIAWDELRRLVAETPDVPSRDKILDILDNTPVWIYSPEGKVVDGRKKQLMDLQGGRPYNWMLANLFPLIRNAVAITLCIKEQPVTAASVAGDDNDLAERHPTPVDTTSAHLPATQQPAEADKAIEATQEPDQYRRHHFALKSNMLLDAALMPNIELQWLINDNWSVALEGDVAWWKPEYKKVYRLAIISPEVRYHFRQRALWHGMYVGAFGGGGLYQLEWLHDGYKGEGLMAGLSFGYMWPIGKHFSLEAGVGAGYMHTRYKVYESLDGHKLHMRTKSLNYFGPLKLRLSIAWRFDIKTKIAKVNSTL